MSQIIPIQTQNLAPRDRTFMEALTDALQMTVKNKPYTAYITRSTPSVFLFLIDQSGSMSEKVTLENGTSTTKDVFLSDALNATLNSLLDRCIKGNDIRDYFEVAVIGYGGKSGTVANLAWQGKLAGKSWVTMTELRDNFLEEREEEVERTVRGKAVKSIVKRKTWIEPLSEYQTPMHNAFTLAAELLEDWIVRYKGINVYPPTILNITDGQFTDAKNDAMLDAAQRIMQLKTMDGNALLFNLHISSKDRKSVLFPNRKEELPENDDYARLLFDMSSDLPEIFNLDIAQMRGTDTMSTFTAMAYNASLDKLIGLMNIGTSTTTRQIQVQNA